MSLYSKFFFTSKTNVAELELIEFSHPSFTQTFYIVRNSVAGVTVTLETGVVQAFTYYPLQITPTGANTDLDQKMKVLFGDVGKVLPQQLDRLRSAATLYIKPVFIYRTYRSDTLSTPLFGPVTFQVQNLAFTKQGATFDISAPVLNLNKTGELYNLDRFPSLRAF